mgnify:CR=1
MRPTPLAIHPAYQNKRYATAFLNAFTGYYTPEQMNNEDGFWVIPRTV